MYRAGKCISSLVGLLRQHGIWFLMARLSWKWRVLILKAGTTKSCVELCTERSRSSETFLLGFYSKDDVDIRNLSFTPRQFCVSRGLELNQCFGLRNDIYTGAEIEGFAQDNTISVLYLSGTLSNLEHDFIDVLGSVRRSVTWPNKVFTP